MRFPEGICKFCLKKRENFKIIDGKTKDVLDILLPKIDFTVIIEPAICRNCAEMVTKCFDFKATCLRTYHYVVPFLNEKDNVKFDLKDIYLSKNVGSSVPDDQDICGFCMGLVEKCSISSLDVEEGYLILKKMVEQCLPEINLHILKKPFICASCLESLENCFRFVTNCLTVEEKIKKYCHTSDINSKGQIKLSSLLQFTTRDVTRQLDGGLVDAIKVEEQFCGYKGNPDDAEIANRSTIIKLEQVFLDGSESASKDVEIKNENFVDVDDHKVDSQHQVTSKNKLTCEEDGNRLGFIKKEDIFFEDSETKHEENFVDIEDQKFLLDEKIEMKTDEHNFTRLRYEGLHGSPTCLISSLEGNLSTSHIKHTLTDKHVSKITMYNCECCSFKTKNKYHLKRHLLVHKDSSEISMHKCDACSFQTKRKEVLKMHLFKHKEPSDVTMYKCETCSFQTRFKFYLQKHFLKHKDPSEVTTYKCDSCSFQTKYANSLEGHLRLHKDPSELTMYKCESCSYQTKYKLYLKRHLLKHKDPSEVTMYKCDSCSFQSNRKEALKRHLLRHKEPSEVTTYKCEACSFQTKSKSYLKKHSLKHKNPSQVTVYECESCSYRTEHKSNLKIHLLLHKDPSELTMYSCDFCSFQSKRKDRLKSHLLSHKASSEVTMQKCDSCPFQTKSIKYLKSHLLVHKNPLEVTMYKCDSCSFQTKHKSNLKTHFLLHRDPSKVTMHKCDSCQFQTRYKRNLEKHFLKHKDTSEVTM